MTATTTIGNGRRRNGLRPFVWGAAGCVLLLPAVAMQFFPDSGVNWTGIDFLAMGLLLSTACGLYELGAWASDNRFYRAGFGIAALVAFLTAWVNLAVGMLGDEDNGANWMFVGVLSIAAAGALIAKMKPSGMARAMVAAAIAQLAAVGVALAMGGFEALELGLTACFALPWLAAAQLFRKAAQDRLRAATPG
ncbi:MAG: hypothetical protein EOP93_08480 [Lysobacteraceae bacterium]|nr:MAG: hypothetical protein EOP93_08480 [Xanthomonadaceae bacterium]